MEFVLEKPPGKDTGETPPEGFVTRGANEQIDFADALRPVANVSSSIGSKDTGWRRAPFHEKFQPPAIRRSHKSLGVAVVIIAVTFALKWIISVMLI